MVYGDYPRTLKPLAYNHLGIKTPAYHTQGIIHKRIYRTPTLRCMPGRARTSVGFTQHKSIIIERLHFCSKLKTVLHFYPFESEYRIIS